MRREGFEPVVVTGLGAVTGWGWGVEPLWRALLAGATGIGPFDRFDAASHRTSVASQVPPAPAALAEAVPGWEGLSLADAFAVAAAREAVGEAGDPLEGRLAGVFFGSSTGAMWESELFFAGLLGHGPAQPARRVASQEYNGPGDAVARHLGTSGPVETVSSACSSGALAIGSALEALREGEVEVALAGGSDSLCQLTYAGFNGLRAVDARPCRPFRADRAGMSLGEGSAVLVLERESDARRRGARVLGRVVGAGASCDAHHMTAPQKTGEGPSLAIRAALADAGLAPEEIDFVNTHGTGTRLNDQAEARALGLVFGDATASLPLTSTKGSVGHLLGSAGAVEALATLLCLRHGRVHPTPGEEGPDPELGVRLVWGEPLFLPGARNALSTSLAFGGSNAALVLGSGEEGA